MTYILCTFNNLLSLIYILYIFYDLHIMYFLLEQCIRVGRWQEGVGDNGVTAEEFSLGVVPSLVPLQSLQWADPLLLHSL